VNGFGSLKKMTEGRFRFVALKYSKNCDALEKKFNRITNNNVRSKITTLMLSHENHLFSISKFNDIQNILLIIGLKLVINK
jgi:hypothetical protein